ncbi:MAG TPA: DUF2497 domain-containing protein [Azospirillum sp.]|nr:DUF2497 domain-containing protein [Azospirillum sp.]
MEEILASIRRIISEDGEPATKTEQPATVAVAAPPSAPSPPPPMMDEEEPEEDVLELTQVADLPGRRAEPEDDPWGAEEPAFPEPPAEMDEPPSPPPPPRRAPPPPPMPDFDDVTEMPPPRPRKPGFDEAGLISRRTAENASQHFTHLARELGDDLSIGPMPVGVRTVEEVVRELLKPLLKEWLDENLPTVVERLVQQEIDRMIRRSQKF